MLRTSFELRRRFAQLAPLWSAFALIVGGAGSVAAQDFEAAPISYSKSTPTDRVARLAADMKAGKRALRYEPEFGYLRSLLKELEVPLSSQTLVFSKTSLQRNLIKAATPRAIYFSDDAYVGYCQDGEVLEISVVDDKLGAVFYTVSQHAPAKDGKSSDAISTANESKFAPLPVRQTDHCLICHASSATRNVPGHTLRSVYSDAAGYPILSSGTYRTDQTSRFEHRWGGWYVTGTHGDMQHLGNYVHDGYGNPERADHSGGWNVKSLKKLFEVDAYPTPHSDIVAHLVLAHQTEAHNCITQAGFGVRQAMEYQTNLNRELGEPIDQLRESTTSRIKSVCEPLVEYLFYCEEAPLGGKVVGTSTFAQEFAAQGPRDKQGRSLRDFDLERRMFKYPCSFLVYSSSFQALPKEAKQYVYRRMKEVLTGKDDSKTFKHLSVDDRRAISEILAETLPDFRK